jgi:hypothetical protein
MFVRYHVAGDGIYCKMILRTLILYATPFAISGSPKFALALIHRVCQV